MRKGTKTNLRSVVQSIIDAHRAHERINPTSVATEAMAKLETADLQRAAHLQLRQIARYLCRKQFADAKGDNALDSAQQELFPGLQSRYPTAYSEGEQPSYVLRAAMTAKDVEFNVQRLRHEGGSKLARARALQAWWDMEVRKTQVRGAAGSEEPMPAPASVAAE